MCGTNVRDEIYLDLSGETLSEFSHYKKADMLSSGLSDTLTSSAGGLASDTTSSFALTKSFKRRARRKAAARAARFHVHSSDFSSLAPANAATKQTITPTGSFALQQEMLLLPGFPPGIVYQMDGKNGCHESSQVDHLCWEPADIVECKYSTLIPTRDPATGFPKADSASEISTQSSNLIDQESKLGLEDSFDSIDGLCGIAPLQPTRSPAYTTPISGSDALGETSDALKTSSIQFSLADSVKSETEVLIHGLEPEIINSTAQSFNHSGFTIASPETTEEAQRIARDKRIFGWVDGVISSPADIPESISTASSSPLLVSSLTGDFLDFLDSDLLVDGSSPSNSPEPPSVSSRQLPICSPNRTSLLDIDYAGATEPPGISYYKIRAVSAPSTGEPLLLDFEDGIQDIAPTKDANPPFSHPQGPPTPASTLPVPISVSSVPPPVGDVSTDMPNSKEIQRKPTVVKVIVSAPKRSRDLPSPIRGPIPPGTNGPNSEVGNAAWNRWVEQNSESIPGAPLSHNTRGQSLKHQNTRRWFCSTPKKSRRKIYPSTSLLQRGGLSQGGSGDIGELKGEGSGLPRRNNYARLNCHGGSLRKSRVERIAEHQDYPICAVPTPVVKPSSAQNATEVAPVTWAGSGLPFMGLASRYGVATTQMTLGYHNPQTVSYKRTSAFNREQKVREQVNSKRPIHLRPKIFKTLPTKRDVWASQEADFMRCSEP